MICSIWTSAMLSDMDTVAAMSNDADAATLIPAKSRSL